MNKKEKFVQELIADVLTFDQLMRLSNEKGEQDEVRANIRGFDYHIACIFRLPEVVRFKNLIIPAYHWYIMFSDLGACKLVHTRNVVFLIVLNPETQVWEEVE